MQYTWQLALMLVPVYFIKHLVSCYISITYKLRIILTKALRDQSFIRDTCNIVRPCDLFIPLVLLGRWALEGDH